MRLDELNVINIENIEKYAAGLAANIEFEPAKKWFQKSIRNLLINDEKFNTRIAQVSPTAPDWMKQRYKENVPLYRFSPSADLTDKLSHIVDWLNSVYQVSQEKVAPNAPKAAARQQLVTYASKILNSLNSIDIKTLLAPKVENVKHHVDDWFDALNKFVKVTGDKDQEMTSEDMQHVIDYDKGAWVELKSDKSLGIEGKLMGHCVGGYGSRVREGGTRIFSLRDNDGMPHVTIEVTDGHIVQVKGKQNQPPVEKYAPYVKDFLNKMHFPPTGGSGRYSSGNNDIKKIGLSYNPTTKIYGTLKEIAKVIYTTPDNYEVLSTDEKDDYSNKPTYYLWKDDALQASINQQYGKEFKIILNQKDKNEDDDARVSDKERKIFAEALDFLNSAFTDFTVSESEKFGFFKTAEDGKFTDINQIPVLKEFSNNITVKKLLGHNGDLEYCFFMPSLIPVEYHTKEYYAPPLFALAKGRIEFEENYEKATFDKKVFQEELAQFLNEINFTPDSSYRNDSTRELLKLDVIKDPSDNKYKSFLQAGKVIKNFGNAKIISVSPQVADEENIYRFYENNSSTPIAAWYMNNRGMKGIEITNNNFRKYVKPFVSYLNENNVRLTGGYDRYSRSERDTKNYLKEWGIVKRGDKWFAGKTTGVDSESNSGWVVEKVGSKQGNIVMPDGKKIATLKYSSAKTVEDLSYDDIRHHTRHSDQNAQEVVTKIKNMYSFLHDWCIKTGVTFQGGSLPSDSKEFGYILKDGVVTHITAVYPTEEILTVDGMTWKKAAMLTKNDNPESGYKYGLYVNGKLQVKLENKNKEIVNITIRNPSYDSGDNERRDNAKTIPFTEANIAPYLKALSELFEKEGLTAKSLFLTKAGLQIKDGKLQAVSDNPKIRGFIDGTIQYEDGTRWRRVSSGDDRWQLEAEPAPGDHYDILLRCNTSDEGITKIDIVSDRARKKPSIYRGYLNDLLDIIEDMNAQSSEEMTAPVAD